MNNGSKFLSWIPGWLGFLLLILVGTAMTINGIVNKELDDTNQLGFVVFGLTAVLVGAFSWIAAGTSRIRGREGNVGVRVEVQQVPWWVWVVDVGLVVLAIVIFYAAR